MSERVERVAAIMEAFGARTGVTTPEPPRRYLWTDAFATFNYLALHRRTGARAWLDQARQLMAQVHDVLGRHRPDDHRSGWISGLAEAEGARHPTAGGLRIGKPLPERTPDEPADERVDWDRDGQYYHYLTRWMHALARAAEHTGDAELRRYGVELARAAHAAFAHRAGGEPRLYWKMSVDLSRPVVTAMGQHDALDGLVATAALNESAELAPELAELAAMCHGRDWASSDALGIGGLLTDAWLLARLLSRVPGPADRLLERVLRDAARSLRLVTLTSRFPDGPAEHRLAFRELGLSLGLAAVERLATLRRAGLPGGAGADAALDALLAYLPLRSRIEAFWEQPAHQSAPSWTEHEDINAVMLATSLLPDGCLGGDAAPAR